MHLARKHARKQRTIPLAVRAEQHAGNEKSYGQQRLNRMRRDHRPQVPDKKKVLIFHHLYAFIMFRY